MLEPPELPDGALRALLGEAFHLRVTELAFLPLGADPGAAAYRAIDAKGARYFVKLRNGWIADSTLALPAYLSRRIAGVVGPLPTGDGRPCCPLDDWTVVLYPFIEGSSAASVVLTPDQWRRLGTMVKQLHTVRLPPELAHEIAREQFGGAARARVHALAAGSGEPAVADPLVAGLAAVLRERRGQIDALVAGAERGAVTLRVQSGDWVVCHADLYAANVLVDREGQVFVVDWDQPVIAPKERDLMFVGGGLGYRGYPPHEEAALFYRGYGPAALDETALTYFRRERIIEDIAAFADEIASTTLSTADRRRALAFLQTIFEPGGVLDLSA
jgi:spectinomycin phosphotransferase